MDVWAAVSMALSEDGVSSSGKALVPPSLEGWMWLLQNKGLLLIYRDTVLP